MMQQGRFVADIAYFYGEDSNLTAIFADKAPDVPQGYNFDYVNADVLPCTNCRNAMGRW